MKERKRKRISEEEKQTKKVIEENLRKGFSGRKHHISLILLRGSLSFFYRSFPYLRRPQEAL